MTYPRIDDYLSQIQYVSTYSRIRYYLRFIKDVIGSQFVQDYEPDDEVDNEMEATPQDNFVDFQAKCVERGIKPPERMA